MQAAADYWEKKKADSQWVYKDGALYYILTQQRDGHRRLMGLEVGNGILESFMKMDNPPYKGTVSYTHLDVYKRQIIYILNN